jgi:DNA-binding transcriptional LysR family regulator
VSMNRPNGFLEIELRHLAALQAVAEEGSFGRAAVRLGYTQSAVSQQIAQLERVVGVKLLDRPGGPRKVSLTEAGRMLLPHADGIMARLQAAHADLAALAEGAAGPLRVGTFQSVGAKVLPSVLRRFTAEWPQIEVDLSEETLDEDLVRAVERGELDVAFSTMPTVDGPFEWVELMSDPYVLVVPKGSPLARGGAPSAREICAQPLVGYRLCRSTDRVLNHLREKGGEPRIVFRSDDNGTVQGVVGAGVGSALMPRLTVDEADPAVEVIPLAGRVPDRVIAMIWHRDRVRTPAADAFIAIAAEVARELSAQPAAA